MCDWRNFTKNMRDLFLFKRFQISFFCETYKPSVLITLNVRVLLFFSIYASSCSKQYVKVCGSKRALKSSFSWPASRFGHFFSGVWISGTHWKDRLAPQSHSNYDGEGQKYLPLRERNSSDRAAVVHCPMPHYHNELRILTRGACDLVKSVLYRGRGGGSTPSPPRNFEGPPKSRRTQPDCENC